MFYHLLSKYLKLLWQTKVYITIPLKMITKDFAYGTNLRPRITSITILLLKKYLM